MCIPFGESHPSVEPARRWLSDKFNSMRGKRYNVKMRYTGQRGIEEKEIIVKVNSIDASMDWKERASATGCLGAGGKAYSLAYPELTKDNLDILVGKRGDDPNLLRWTKKLRDQKYAETLEYEKDQRDRFKNSGLSAAKVDEEVAKLMGEYHRTPLETWVSPQGQKLINPQIGPCYVEHQLHDPMHGGIRMVPKAVNKLYQYAERVYEEVKNFSKDDVLNAIQKVLG